MKDRVVLLAHIAALWSANACCGQSGSYEAAVGASLFPGDGVARSAQLPGYNGTNVIVSNPFIGALGDADILLQRIASDGSMIQDLTIGDVHGQGYHDVAKEALGIDSHIYLCGYTRDIDTSAAHTFTAFLIEVGEGLNVLGQRNYMIPDREMYAEAFTPSGDAMLLTAGKIHDSSEFRSYVMRTDLSGAVIWIKQYSMPQGETIECVRELPGGDILICGSMVFGFELQLPFVCKLNADGDLLWGRYYNYPQGFVERSNFQFMHVSSVDHILLTGVTDKFGAGGTDFYAVDIDSSGAVNWARTYGGSQSEELSGAVYDPSTDELVMLGSSGSFATPGEPDAIAMRIAPDGNMIGAALYGDTGVYLPTRLYHVVRFGPNSQALIGSRDFPADDMYIAGTDSAFANSCHFYPVSPQAMDQTTGTGVFSATVTVPVLAINDVQLGQGHYSNDTLLCEQSTSLPDSPHPASGLLLFPTPGDGVFNMTVPASFKTVVVRLLDLQGRLIWSMKAMSDEVRLPSKLAPGSYLVQLIDSAGRRLSAHYDLR